jgi:hypothetical protein
MTRETESKSNGCFVISKVLGIFIAIFTIIAVVWGASSKMNVAPVAQCVEKLETRVMVLENNDVDQRILLARMNAKLDFLVEQAKEKKK